MRLAWLFLLGIGAAGAQAVPPETAAALQRLAKRASIIFAGQVLRVDRHDAAGFVDVLFKVNSAVVGCSSPGTYRLREWAGLWGGSSARYLPGQRWLMLLRATGPGGMTAPVGGMAGRIPLVAVRMPPLLQTDGTVAPVSHAASDEMAVDLRWVVASEIRHPVIAQPLSQPLTQPLAQPLAASRIDPFHPDQTSLGPVPATWAEWIVTPQNPGLNAVLALLEASSAR